MWRISTLQSIYFHFLSQNMQKNEHLSPGNIKTWFSSQTFAFLQESSREVKNTHSKYECMFTLLLLACCIYAHSLIYTQTHACTQNTHTAMHHSNNCMSFRYFDGFGFRRKSIKCSYNAKMAVCTHKRFF